MLLKKKKLKLSLNKYLCKHIFQQRTKMLIWKVIPNNISLTCYGLFLHMLENKTNMMFRRCYKYRVNMLVMFLGCYLKHANMIFNIPTFLENFNIDVQSYETVSQDM